MRPPDAELVPFERSRSDPHLENARRKVREPATELGGVSLDGARSQRAFIGFPLAGQADTGRQVLKTKSDQFGVSVGVSWELDL